MMTKGNQSGAGDGNRGPSEGPECRGCGCRHLPVQHTERRGKIIIRYRKCRHCGKPMMTRERAAGDDDA